MRILFLSNVYPSTAAPGKGVFNRLMIEGLRESHDVHVVVPVSWTERISGRGRAAGRTETYSELTWYYPPKVMRGRYADFMWWSIRSALRKIAADFRPEVVLSYWMHPDGDIASRIADELQIPFVAMSGGSDVLLLGQDPKRSAHIDSVMSRADHVVAIGQHLADSIVDRGIPEQKVSVLYRGVDKNRFHPGNRIEARHRLGLAPEGKVVISAGRLVNVKSQATLIKAAELLHHRGEEVSAFVIGEGPLRDDLQHQIDDSECSVKPKLIGRCDHNQLADWYRAADVVVLPSLSEGVPNVLVEAIASGARIVASNVGGIPEILDPRYDRLVEPKAAESFANAISEVLASPYPRGERSWIPSTQAESTEVLEAILRGVVHRVVHATSEANRAAELEVV